MTNAIRICTAVALLAAITLSTTGCAGKKASPIEIEKQAFDDVRAEIQSVVTDPERAAKASELVSAIEQSFVDTKNNVATRKAHLIELNADYDASRADIEADFHLIAADIEANRQQISSIHRQWREILTAEEWDEIEKARSEALEAAIKTLRSI
jgi:hypothetical protein